jgi:hypothetical protein
MRAALLPLIPMLAVVAGPTSAAEPSGGDRAREEVVVDGRAAFPVEVQRDGERFVLSGAGLFRWKWVVKVYAAAHWFGDGAARDPQADVPRRLEIAYFVPFDAEDFGRAADALLEEAFPAETLAPLRARIDRLNRAYLPVKPGDRYTLTYLPGRGTELALNGRPLDVIDGADFARVYLAMWTGAKPIDSGLRDALLGRDRAALR